MPHNVPDADYALMRRGLDVLLSESLVVSAVDDKTIIRAIWVLFEPDADLGVATTQRMTHAMAREILARA